MIARCWLDTLLPKGAFSAGHFTGFVMSSLPAWPILVQQVHVVPIEAIQAKKIHLKPRQFKVKYTLFCHVGRHPKKNVLII